MKKTGREKDFEKINKGIESVRPYLIADGGDIEVVELTDDNILKVRLKGACDGCPFSVMTLKAGIEQAVKKEWPALKSLESV
jgi:Fe-S cluster biogenesis protein NfuA